MSFWLITFVMALGSCAMLALALWRGHQHMRPAAEFDLNVYRDQLAEVERDAARGVLEAEDAQRLRTEISRRILAADKSMQSEQADTRSPKAVQIVLVGVSFLVLFIGSTLLYWGTEPVFKAFERNYVLFVGESEIPVSLKNANQNPFRFSGLGAPGYGDLSLKARIESADIARKTRPNQADAEASLPPAVVNPNTPEDYIKLVEKLRTAVSLRPDDLQGAELLATHEMRLGNAMRAHIAQSHVLRLKESNATAEDFATYADMLVIAAGGYVSPQAEAALVGALKKDPKNGVARYYTGLMMLQTGRPDVAFRAWATLLQDSPADAGWVGPIRAQIEELAFRAGVEYELPELKEDGLAGPSGEDVANASEMSAEERQEMIAGMVSRLSDRLATDGGSPEEWAQLISALGVLGDADRATLIWQNAKEVFADTPEALDIVRSAAQKLGITQ